VIQYDDLEKIVCLIRG